MAKRRNASTSRGLPADPRYLTRSDIEVVSRGGKVVAVRKARSNPARSRNVAAGFYDEDGYFHPIRASFDYDRRRGGDAKKKNPRKRRASAASRAAVWTGNKRNPKQMLFKSRSAATAYARAHGAAKFSVKKLKRGK
jgi:hypothetical protein